MTLADVATLCGTAIGSAVVALRGRHAWHRLLLRKDGIPRCELCSHRCTYCRKLASQVSDPPFPDEDDTTPKRNYLRRR